MRIAITAVVAVALAVLASIGIYAAAQPAAPTANTQVITYGTK